MIVCVFLCATEIWDEKQGSPIKQAEIFMPLKQRGCDGSANLPPLCPPEEKRERGGGS